MAKKKIAAEADTSGGDEKVRETEHSQPYSSPNSDATPFGNYPVRDIALNSIGEMPGRMRGLTGKKVDDIADSMKASGLINPITVRPMPGGIPYCWVAGLHRMQAAKKLKWKLIKCYVRTDLDDDSAKLIEIDENLRRSDLSAAQRQVHMTARRELWEKRNGIPAHECTSKGGRGKKGFAAETAAELGKSKSQINRDLAGPKPKKPKPKVEMITLTPGDAPGEWFNEDGERCDRETGEPITKKAWEQVDGMLGTLGGMATWPIESAALAASGAGSHPDVIATGLLLRSSSWLGTRLEIQLFQIHYEKRAGHPRDCRGGNNKTRLVSSPKPWDL